MGQPIGQPIYLVTPPTSGVATTSMILGIIGIVTGCCSFGLPSLAAIICGHVAIGQTKSGTVGGRGMAVAGLVLGYIVLAPAIVFSIWMLIGGGMAAVTGVAPSATPTP
jgi:Domain of unknown function (DUF4190)